ncbi:hypothetical protein [Tateyamaria sp.]|uniref:hypothetical protein n=1 Tax=Tateyamaria sp. TaxID=1929288 RepID=UPI00329D7B6B
MQQPIIVWDFDGVLNANVIDGRFVWADRLQQDWGIDRAALVAHLFHRDRIGRIMRGQIDLRDELQFWLTDAGHNIDADVFLAYWFANDALPDAKVVRHLERSDATHVIGTNNEARRAAYLLAISLHRAVWGMPNLTPPIFAISKHGAGRLHKTMC